MKLILATTLAFIPGVFPMNALQGLPLLKEQLQAKWPEYKYPHYLSAQIEQETCASVKSKKCWTTRAELKTEREYGFSFGQITIAYNKDGTERFNNFEAVKKLDKELEQWQFKDRFDERYGMIALIAFDRQEYNLVGGPANEHERNAFMFAAYNGGRGGVLQDRRLCKTIKGCDQSKWFDNVELYSYKAKVVSKGYGKSFFEINREYVRNIMYVRSPKYVDYFRNYK